MRRLLWALLSLLFFLLAVGGADAAWIVSEGFYPNRNLGVLVIAFAAALFATIAVFCLREFFRNRR
jgi:O-antigen ligase